MCCAEFIVKYVLYIANLAFSLLGLAIIGLSIAVLVSLKDLSEILPIEVLAISCIGLGAIVFFVGFLACCGAVRESQCMLWTYSLIVALLAATKVYLAVVLFGHLSDLESTVDQWIVTAFNNNDLRPTFHVMEASFRCCGTTGPDSYTINEEAIPVTCCDGAVQCTTDAAFRGCGDMIGNWFESFGGAVGSVLVVVIAVEVVAVVFALFFANSIRNKRHRTI